MTVTAELLEREAELDAVDASIARARAGRGSVLLVEGPPGIGKTALLEAARERAGEAGFTALRARGSELERDFAFGVARQLFERPIAELGNGEREEVLAGAAGLASPLLDVDAGGPQPAGAGRELFPLLHGLHWLCSNLAEDEPLLLAVDDAHWADQQSLRFLDYLAGRIDELPVLVTAGARSTAPEAPVELIEGLRQAPAVDDIAPGALSEAGVEELLAAVLSERPDREFARAAERASGGNPFLLTELARALAEDGVPPRDEAISQIEAITPEAIANSVLSRLGRMPGEAAEVARSAAVLGDGADPRAVSALSGLPVGTADQAADALVEGGVLGEGLPFRFAHPLVRAAIYDDLATNERGRMHARAAEVLDGLGRDAEASAGHLLRAHPGGEGGRLTLLRNAADSALDRAAPAAAADYLRRALEEGPGEADRRTLLGALGRAQVQLGAPEGIESLRSALERSVDPRERADLARVMALGLAQAGRYAEGVGVIAAELGAASDASDAVRRGLECDYATVLIFGLDSDFSALDRLLARTGDPEATSPADRGLLAVRAYRLAQRGREPERAVAIANRAVAEGLLDDFAPGWPPYLAALYALITCGALDTARRLAEEALARARAAATTVGIVQSANSLAFIALREGRLADAESHASEAVETARATGIAIGLAAGLAALTDARVERGRADAAWAELEEIGLTGELPPVATAALLLESRGRLRAARGDAAGAVHDLIEAGAWNERAGGAGPSISSWRSHLALAQLQVGQPDEARRFAEQDLELARRFGAPRPIGIALRALGLIEGGERGFERLAEAADELGKAGDRLEQARALVDLGAALRRGNRRADARERLREGLDLAARCGATVLADRAREELLATGARPRKPFYSGVEALTASELRTARMAGEGMTNREVAQALFVTPKTVETHLRHAYQKLDIPGRSGLADALESSEASQ